MEVCISPRKSLVILLLTIFALTAASLTLNLLRIYTGRETIFNLIRLLDLDGEGNLPAIFSVLMLISSSALLSFIALDHKRSGKAYLHWLWLAVVFCCLAFDEGGGIHEITSEWVRPLIRPSGALTHVWVVPYGLLFIIIAATYFRFWLGLKKETRVLMALSGAVYVCGAIGWEMVGAVNYVRYGDNRGLGYTLMYTAEEFMEMAGVAIFLYALLRYIQHNSITVTLCCHPESARKRDALSDKG